MAPKPQAVSAQVILRSAGGKSAHGRAAITAANLGDYLPSPQTVRRAREAFAALGFQVGDAVGISFSIEAPAQTFERVFQTNLRGRSSDELPLAALPADVTADVEAVTFTPPPDFGPGQLGP